MKKILLYTLLACTLVAASAPAGTFKVPNEDFAIASVTIPDKWKPKEIDKGVEANSPDGEVYIAVDAVGSDKGIDEEIDDTFKMLKDNKVAVDASTKKENKFKIAGVDATELQFAGKMEDEAQTISIVFVPINKKLVVVTYWSSVAGDKDKADSEAVVGILKSLKAL